MEPQRPDRLTTSNIFRSFFEDFLNADRGMWGTIVQLTLRPQRVVQTFLFEDRSRYIRPTRYVLFSLSIAALSFFAVQWRYGQPLHEYLLPTIEVQGDEMAADLQATMNEKAKAEGKELTPERRKENQQMITAMREKTIQTNVNLIKYGNYLGLLGMPIIALGFWLMFPRVSYNYPEHLAATGYIFGHASVLNLLTIPFVLLATSPTGLLQAILYSSIFTLLYQCYATGKVYIQSFKDALIALAVCVLALIAFALVLSSAGYVVGYLMAATTKKVGVDCENCGLSWWKVGRVIPPLIFMAALFYVRLKPRRWHWGLGVGVISLGVYFALIN